MHTVWPRTARPTVSHIQLTLVANCLSIHRSPETSKRNRCKVHPGPSWVHPQAAAVEGDHGLELGQVPVATSPPCDGHDLALQTLCDGVGDSMSAGGDDVVEPSLNHSRDCLHRLQAAADRPRVPAVEAATCPAFDLVGPEVPQVLLRWATPKDGSAGWRKRPGKVGPSVAPPENPA